MGTIGLLLAIALLGLGQASATSIFLDSLPSQDIVVDPCFDEKSDKPVSCVPDFVNAAFGVRVEPTYGKDEKKHTKFAQFLTDLHNPNNETCWQGDFHESENVSLTISLKKKYELTYISLHFCHEKPDTMVIYKSMDHGKTWQTFQYYSNDCLGTFNRQKDVSITRANEQEALCVDSHLGPDAGTRIAFSTLADRPSAEDFEHSPVLQDWVTATDIRITFPSVNKNRLQKNEIDFSFDNETSETAAAKKQQRRIGISDLAIGGRCKCNGHASDCSLDPTTGEMNCNCQHNTAGRECEKCKGKSSRNFKFRLSHFSKKNQI